MDSFNKTVLGIALAILILVLTYAGIKMIYYKEQIYGYFPPTSASCPDYWTYDGKYCIPNGKNTGLYKSGTTPGFNSDTGGFDPNDNGWSSYKQGNLVCNQQIWAATNKVIWDGVSNNTSCANTKK